MHRLVGGVDTTHCRLTELPPRALPRSALHQTDKQMSALYTDDHTAPHCT